MASNNPYAKPNGGYSAYSSSNPYGQASTSYTAAAAGAYPPVAAAGPAYPAYPSAGPAAGPSIPAGGYDMNLAQQSSIYTPEAAKSGRPVASVANKGKARTTVLRKGGGEVWEDQSLLEWDPSHFRLFIGDLDPAISDDAFQAAFSGPRFPSFVKSKVIRDKYTNKGRGYGFVSYSDPEDFLKAWKEMNGKYVGMRPVTIKKANAGVKAVNIGSKKAQQLEAKQPQKTGTVPYERANAEEAGHRAIPGEKGYGPQRSRKTYIRR
ncbi:RNA-binding protein [Rhodotorula toruloides]|uniref:BY PROTMAP: gi/472581395/gb/EMS19134.1/ RNA-binding protein [Rhodosporidium toruloides NP11] gi/647395417/emb/CDR36817.1/ RHTO0S02e07206g1_1 [Rhodosporidium toruloides] n=1 Tax=Rhodotorula toruloides TaxID=5286 RepID=A0A0K3CHX0_RHOTO|nr:RNA-binding protein [Rhodotorula toruloides]PRQ73246.1 hypothetical protein AAT19DRAFT_15999 [Rhodotorula toruloides]